jgi:hypothetical protein
VAPSGSDTDSATELGVAGPVMLISGRDFDSVPCWATCSVVDVLLSLEVLDPQAESATEIIAAAISTPADLVNLWAGAFSRGWVDELNIEHPYPSASMEKPVEA